jgi:hypothetical protein
VPCDGVVLLLLCVAALFSVAVFLVKLGALTAFHRYR